MTEYCGFETVEVEGDVRSFADLEGGDVAYEVIGQECYAERREYAPYAETVNKRVGGKAVTAAGYRVAQVSDQPVRRPDWREVQFKDN